MKLSEVTATRELVGRKVKANVKFPGVPVGTTGEIKSYFENDRGREEIRVEWEPTSPNRAPLVDWFSRDDIHNEFELLELVV